MPIPTTRFDVQDRTRTPEDQVAYLEAAIEDGDRDLILAALIVTGLAAGRKRKR